MDLIDTHAHLTFEQYTDTLSEVLNRSKAAGVSRWVTVGTNLEDSEKAVSLAGENPQLYAAVGIHPHDARTVTDSDIRRLKELATDEKAVAIGETGLDFHYYYSDQQSQENVFKQHISLAAELDLPLIIHSRNAFEQTLDILENAAALPKRIVFHCFSGSAEQAQELTDKGFYISFTGMVTFKNAHAARQAVQAVPARQIMVETDCPFMSPEPMRKQRTNEPALMIHTARKLAELKEIDEEEFADLTTATAEQFFSLPPAE